MHSLHNGRRSALTRRLGIGISVATVAGLLLSPAPASAATTCSDIQFPVKVGGTAQSMHGTLCSPPGATTVEVLIPGGTYNQSYWDIGYQPEMRSFRRAMNNDGIATLAVDRLGTGRSSRPLSVTVTATTQATAVHQVIQSMRSGSRGPRFAKVIVGGHSIGSAMAMIEAGLYRDVDGVLVTGMTHGMNWTTVAPTLAKMIPAVLDPQLKRSGLDLGYVTTSPGSRYPAFHTPGPKISGALQFDESTKDVFALTEAVDSATLTTVVTPISRRITAPVMIVMGDDPNFCGPPLGMNCTSDSTLRASEAPFYPLAPSVSAFVLHGYGHAINYAPNAPVYFNVAAAWARSIGS